MSETVVQLVTLYCDIPSCNNEIMCGSDFHYAENNGWKRQVPIFDDRDYDMCPTCVDDLKDFLSEPTPDDESDETPDLGDANYIASALLGSDKE